jgi:hypothetical protein
MRKYAALTLVALLALSMAMFVMSCAKKAEETPAATQENTTTPPAETSTMSDSSAAMPDTSHH